MSFLYEMTENKIKFRQTSGGIFFNTRTSVVDSRRRRNPGIPGTSSGKKSSTNNSGASAIVKNRNRKKRLLKKLFGQNKKPSNKKTTENLFSKIFWKTFSQKRQKAKLKKPSAILKDFWSFDALFKDFSIFWSFNVWESNWENEFIFFHVFFISNFSKQFFRNWNNPNAPKKKSDHRWGGCLVKKKRTLSQRRKVPGDGNWWHQRVVVHFDSFRSSKLLSRTLGSFVEIPSWNWKK